MRIPDRAHWVARRLYSSLSHAAKRGRPLSFLQESYHVDPLSSQKLLKLTKVIVPSDTLSTTLRHFLSSSQDVRSQLVSPVILLENPIFSNVYSQSKFTYSTEREAGQADGEVETLEEAKRSQQTDDSNSGSRYGQSGDGGRIDGSGWSKKEVLNWPNAISLGRLLSGPMLAWMITQGLAKPALVGLVLAGGSDWLDGYIARRMGINSVLGSYLDPLADKVLVGCIAVSMAYSGLLHPALVALIVARDGVLLAGTFLYRAYTLRWQWSGWDEFFKIGVGGVEKVKPLYISKVNMVLQLALIGTALVQPALEIQDTYSLIPILSWSVVATTTLSWIGYAWVYFRRPIPTALVGRVTHLSQQTKGHAAGQSSKREKSSCT